MPIKNITSEKIQKRLIYWKIREAELKKEFNERINNNIFNQNTLWIKNELEDIAKIINGLKEIQKSIFNGLS